MSDYFFHKAVVEIRYRDGIVFLDKCGSLMLALERVLGEPFKGAVPTMEHGELTSELERIVVRYGPGSVVVDQTWLETPVRIHKVAPLAWGEVARQLGVEGKVTRCGLRVWCHWPAKQVDEAESALASSKLIQETEAWTSIFGSPTARRFTGIARRDGAQLRAEVGVARINVNGRLHPDDERFAPPCAIALDIDAFVDDPGKFTADQLRSFLTSHFENVRRAADQIGKLLDV